MPAMETFVWDVHFTTGIAAVDNQHRELVHLINGLGGALMEGRGLGDADLQMAFDRLSAYAGQHFGEEEALMAESGISARHQAEHQMLHGEFVKQLGLIWSTRGSTSDPASVLHGFLSAWLAMHILGVDQSMARQLAAVRAGADPEEAYGRELAHQDNATAALLLAIQSLYRVMARQNAGLVQANQLLEARVLQRTAALAQSNAHLTHLNVKLEDMSHRDGLLGIANRRRFDECLLLEWRRAARVRSPLSLLMIDVDHFKRYNDRYGHPAGDRCLQAVAQAAAAATAKRPADLLARYGGEELVVLLPDTPAAGALVVARDILRAIHALHLPHDDSPVAPEVTVSIGTATLNPAPDVSPDALLLQADATLYAAKAAGRNRVVADQQAAVATSTP